MVIQSQRQRQSARSNKGALESQIFLLWLLFDLYPVIPTRLGPGPVTRDPFIRYLHFTDTR